ncbi:MAG: hypothetical protein ABIS03_02130 [Gemmatimonadaceae bacterium]
MIGSLRRIWFLTVLAAAIGCNSGTAAPLTEISGTWGGEDAGLIAAEKSVHIHVGCTLGDTDNPIRPRADGSFEASGTYNVDAYPVNRGIIHPATFSGRVAGDQLTLTITLTDTTRVIGPVILVKGKEPKMGPCPICRDPNVDPVRRAAS